MTVFLKGNRPKISKFSNGPFSAISTHFSIFSSQNGSTRSDLALKQQKILKFGWKLMQKFNPKSEKCNFVNNDYGTKKKSSMRTPPNNQAHHACCSRFQNWSKSRVGNFDMSSIRFRRPPGPNQCLVTKFRTGEQHFFEKNQASSKFRTLKSTKMKIIWKTHCPGTQYGPMFHVILSRFIVEDQSGNFFSFPIWKWTILHVSIMI